MILERKDLRGRAGAAGRRSMITDRGGTGRAANCRMTKDKFESISMISFLVFFCFYQFGRQY